jgi:hypothetical protein
MKKLHWLKALFKLTFVPLGITIYGSSATSLLPLILCPSPFTADRLKRKSPDKNFILRVLETLPHRCFYKTKDKSEYRENKQLCSMTVPRAEVEMGIKSKTEVRCPLPVAD